MRRSSNENIIGNGNRIKEGRRMNFNNKRTRRIVSIVVLIVIIAMVATMIIPYLV